MSDPADAIAPLRDFVRAMTRLVSTSRDEAALVAGTEPLLAKLIARDDWLPDACAEPHPEHYRQYLLHCDPEERFSVVSFVWGPGQKTPLHDHTVWGLIGILRGAEHGTRYTRAADGHYVPEGPAATLRPGAIDIVSPTRGDLHVVANARTDGPSVSIHVYGANIGAVRRHAFDAATGASKDFVSGYSSAFVPNLWDRSRHVA